MGKKLYLAGKLGAGELPIADFAAELTDRRHTILEPWWEQGKLPTPYLDHPATSIPAAEAMIAAAMDCEVMILFPGDRILGAAVELGAAIASARTDPEKLVIVVNPAEVRQSVFYAHPQVVRVAGIVAVRSMAWY